MNKKKTRESGKTKDQGAKNQLKSETPGVTEAELRELLQRTQANFENYRKQTEKRIADIRQSASQGIILELLPILDNLSLALKNAQKHTKHEDFVEGVKLIYQQCVSMLEKNDVVLMETQGKKFDPYFHEAMLKMESEQPENTIVEEFQKGYLLHERVLRHAKVKVSAGKKK